ncbi:MAG: hypothetical protein GF355_09580 [Candidatus Eisenbacteria bacterium]|nr:hypothetical protein [Candidatus Eisenbacteria bacterium]
MSYQYTLSWLDIFNRALRRVGLPQVATLAGASVRQALLLDLLKEAYKEVNSISEWPWLEEFATLKVYASYLELTADITDDTIDVFTWPSDAETDYWVNGWAHLQGIKTDEPAFFFIKDVSGAGGQLGEIKIAPKSMTDAAQETVRLYQDGIVLPSNFSRPVETESFITNYENLLAVDYYEIQRMRVYERLGAAYTGDPQAYCVYSDVATATGDHANERQRRLILYPFPDKDLNLKIHYIRNPIEPAVGSDLFKMPPQHAEAVILLALADFHAVIGENVTQRDTMRESFLKEMRKMMSHYERSSNRPSIRPDEMDRKIYQSRSVFG